MAKKKPITRKQKSGEWNIEISDSAVTPDGKFVAKATLTNENKQLVKYAYGFTKEEAQTNIDEAIGWWV